MPSRAWPPPPVRSRSAFADVGAGAGGRGARRRHRRRARVVRVVRNTDASCCSAAAWSARARASSRAAVLLLCSPPPRSRERARPRHPRASSSSSARRTRRGGARGLYGLALRRRVQEAGVVVTDVSARLNPPIARESARRRDPRGRSLAAWAYVLLPYGDFPRESDETSSGCTPSEARRARSSTTIGRVPQQRTAVSDPHSRDRATGTTVDARGDREHAQRYAPRPVRFAAR